MASISLKRIVRDVSNAAASAAGSLAESGIYYFPDESNIKRGLALLIGPRGTPYFGGYYYFSVTFPDEYPFVPLQVRTLTQDGTTRFNPNLYKDGKVCLSILNTWHDGPQWSGVQTLESVLRSILSDVFVANPIENEPAFRNCGPTEDALVYSRCVTYGNIRTAVLGMLIAPPVWAAPHIELMRSIYQKTRPELLTMAMPYLALEGTADICRVFAMRVAYEGISDLVENLKLVKT